MPLLGDGDLRQRHELVRSTTPSRVAALSPDAERVAVEGVVRVHEASATLPLADATVLEPDDAADDSTPGRAAAASTGDGAPESATTGDETAAGVDGAEAPSRLDELAAEQGDEERGSPVLVRYVRRPRDGREPVETRLDARPFVVEDETGRLLVDPREASPSAILLSPAVTERFLGDDSGGRLVRSTGADATRETARARNALGTTPAWAHERATLRAGDRVYVLGRPETDAEGRAVVVPGESGTFVVSDLSRTALAEQLERAAGGLDRRFWRFAVVGAIAAVLVLITIGVFLDSFVL